MTDLKYTLKLLHCFVRGQQTNSGFIKSQDKETGTLKIDEEKTKKAITLRSKLSSVGCQFPVEPSPLGFPFTLSLDPFLI